MSYELNNVTTANGYTNAATLSCPRSTRVTLYVRNASVYYQLGQGWPSTSWGPEKFLPPGTLSGQRTCDAIRLRSALAGAPAQVTVDAGAGGT